MAETPALVSAITSFITISVRINKKDINNSTFMLMFFFACCKSLHILWDRLGNDIIQQFLNLVVLRTTNLGCLIFTDHNIFLSAWLSCGKTLRRILNEDSTSCCLYLLWLHAINVCQQCYKFACKSIMVTTEDFFSFL